MDRRYCEQCGQPLPTNHIGLVCEECEEELAEAEDQEDEE